MIFEQDFRRQLLATLSVNILTVCIGVSIGWPSASLLLLQSKNTPLPTGMLTITESSWVSSYMALGGFAGNILIGWLSECAGRKTLLLVSVVPNIAGWALVYFSQNVYYLYVGRVLQGLTAGAIYVLTPIFVAEISDNRIRGTLGALFMFSANVGIMLAFIMGYYVDYMIVPIIMLTMCSIYILSMIFQHETPQYLISHRKIDEAEISLRFYRNIGRKSTKEQNALRSEMNLLKSNQPADKTEGDQNDDINKITWRDFVTPVARKALFTGIFLLWLKQFAGIATLVMYAGQIFKDAGSSISPNVAAMVIGGVQLLGTYISATLVDRVGRKVLLTFSTIGTGLSLVTLGAYTYLKANERAGDAFGWVPMISVSSVLLFGSCGIWPMPFVVMSEIMPQKIRSIGSSIGMTSLWGFGFVTIKSFPPMLEMFGMHVCMFGFAACSFIGTIFVNTYMIETKGKSFEEILRRMEGRSAGDQ